MHLVVFEAFREAARSARMSRFDATGRRTVEPLDADVEAAIRDLAPRNMLIDRLVAPLVVATAGARSACCSRGRALALRDALLDAHRRGSVYYAEKNFQGTPDNDRLVAEALLDGNQADLILHVRACTEHARALDGLLRDLAVVATVDESRRRSFRAAWPAVMDAVLDAVTQGRDIREDRYGGTRAFAGTLPRPTPTGQETDIEGVVRAAASGWPTVLELSERIERWIPLAEGTAEGVDAMVGFLETAPLAEQIAGLSWVMRIVAADFSEVANRSYYLSSWLERLRASGELDAGALGEYQRMVDGLVAAGDSRALGLQIALEQ